MTRVCYLEYAGCMFIFVHCYRILFVDSSIIVVHKYIRITLRTTTSAFAQWMFTSNIYTKIRVNVTLARSAAVSPCLGANIHALQQFSLVDDVSSSCHEWNCSFCCRYIHQIIGIHRDRILFTHYHILTFSLSYCATDTWFRIARYKLEFIFIEKSFFTL